MPSLKAKSWWLIRWLIWWLIENPAESSNGRGILA
jgi:hypothetical protein